MIEQVGTRAARIIRTRNRSTAGVWRAIALIGFIGWSVVIPMMLGIAAGLWIDRRWPSRFSWTLTLLVAGLALGCATAWSRIKDAQEDR
jgi:ATP synthase protein I